MIFGDVFDDDEWWFSLGTLFCHKCDSMTIGVGFEDGEKGLVWDKVSEMREIMIKRVAIDGYCIERSIG